MYTHRVENEFTQRKGKYHTSHQNHPTLTKQIRGNTSQYLLMEEEPTHKASHRRRVEVEFNKANRPRDRTCTSQDLSTHNTGLGLKTQTSQGGISPDIDLCVTHI